MITAEINSSAATTDQNNSQPARNSENLEILQKQKEALADRSYQVSRRLFQKEFNLALMKGVAVIGLVIVIIGGTLAFFVPRALAFAITAAIISVLSAVLAHFYNRRLKAAREEREEIRQEYSEVCKKMDALKNEADA